jgi:IS30 family transposase
LAPCCHSQHQRKHQRAATQIFPKGIDITDDQTYLGRVIAKINNRARCILGYRTPAEAFADLLASSIASTGGHQGFS